MTYSAFNDVLRKFSVRYQQEIKQFCEPLTTHLAVKHFWFYRVTKEGYYNYIGSHIEFAEYYYSEKLYLPNPYLRHPDNFQSGISLIRRIEDHSFQDSVDAVANKFNLNQNLLFLKKTGDGLQGFGFASDPMKTQAETLYLNELPLFRLFIKRFKKKFQKLLKKMDENMIDIATPMGTNFFKKKECIPPRLNNRNIFLKKMGINELPILSTRENEMLCLLQKGYSSAQIAEALSLSKRTIEHYMDNLKNKLNYFSKSELLRKSLELSDVGYFNF